MKRHILLSAGLIVLLSFGLAACGRREEPAETQNRQEQTTAAQPAAEPSSSAEEETLPDPETTGAGEAVSRESGGEETAADREELFDNWEFPVRESPLDAQTRIQSEPAAAAVEPYTVEEDLSNVENLWQFYLQEEVKSLLAQNGFSVAGSAGREFFEIYETNRYENKPSFVTVDSMMHTYHLYFSYLMKKLEQNQLTGLVRQLTERMLQNSRALYETMKGSEWEQAAGRCLTFFAVGAGLLDENAQLPEEVREPAEAELSRILAGESMELSGITGRMEDYSQYVPRGYYEGDEELERYFRVMMLYGRTHFVQEDADLDRSALLITQMLSEDAGAYGLWQSVYDITAFFAGASDDLGVDQYLPVFRKLYGENSSAEVLIGDTAGFELFRKAVTRFSPPRIHGVSSGEGDHGETPGFRFMGQRFTIDAAVMQELVHDNVAGRMLPDVLDVPAVLGSEEALRLLAESGASDYDGYPEQMERLRDYLSEENETLWSASLYAGWLDTLRPLLEEKGEGYPPFMQNEEWAKKNLECFAGSFTELKHDTVLYTKQVMAEMGGGYEETDDRGYAEPEPAVYARFAELAGRTARGLDELGLLEDADRENLSRLSQMAVTLEEISVKELRDEVLTDEEYEFIRGFGGSLEHFWIETVRDREEDEDLISTQNCPAAIVTDIATGDGRVLELATDTPSLLQVIVKVDGKLKIAQGSVYSFYQFPWPAEDRLTDSRWQQMRGLSADDSGYYNLDSTVKKPAWTLGYRYLYGWE